MREKRKHIPKNCKWPLEVSPLTGLPKEYMAPRAKWKHKKRWNLQRALQSEYRKKKELNWRAKLWTMLVMENVDTTEAALIAYNKADTPEARKFAMAISSRNKNDKRVQEFAQDVAEEHGKTILELSKSADKDSVRLAAAINILDRLGFKAPTKIEIDDKRELTDEDRIAIQGVIEILSPKITEAEIIEKE